MKYSSIHISNFRAISDLTLDNFKQVNLITGRNNSGKTTVLEALFQISGMSNPSLPVSINSTRALNLTPDDDFSSLFYNLDFTQYPKISAMLDNTRRALTIKPKYAAMQDRKIFNGTAVNYERSPVSGIILEFNDGKSDEIFISEYSLSANGIKGNDLYEEKLVCELHSPQKATIIFPQRIEKLIVNKQIGGVIEALKEIDKKISDIRMGTNETLFIDIGLDKLIPMNIMGDGIRRVLSILAAVSATQDGVLLIDEIENGLHYSSLEILWKALLKATDVYNVQLFVTTHSNECLKALSASIPDNTDMLRLYRIERDDTIHRAFEYPPDMIAACVEANIEMR